MQHAKHHQSQIAFAESKITNIDKNIIKVLQLLSIVGQLESDIEQIRLDLADDPHFYPEALFCYLKQYSGKSETARANNDAFDFSIPQKALVSNIINSSKDGIIRYNSVGAFVKSEQNCTISSDVLKQIERQYHLEQYNTQFNQTSDQQHNHYPLPQDVDATLKLEQQLKNQTMNTMQVPMPQLTSNEILNSGDGFNYNTFLRMFLSQSIPLAKQKARKRKLIYEPNTKLEVDSRVLELASLLFRYESELFSKAEKVRVELAHEGSFNQVGMFNILDAHGNGEIMFSVVEQLMTKSQIPFKPRNFKAIVSRAQLMSNNPSIKEVILFEDFRQLVSVQSPYFRVPKSGDDSTQASNIEYSRILGAQVAADSRSCLSLSRIPDKLKNTQQTQLKPQMPLYISNNQAVSDVIKQQQSKTHQRDMQNVTSDYIIYGTKKEWEELSHCNTPGVVMDQQSLQSQILKIQQSQISIQRPRINSNQSQNDPNSRRMSHIEGIGGQAIQETLARRTENIMNKHLQNARNTNTKQYYTNNNQQGQLQQVQQQYNQLQLNNKAPWYMQDQVTDNKVKAIHKQQDELIKLSGLKQLPNPQLNRNTQSNRQLIMDSNVNPAAVPPQPAPQPNNANASRPPVSPQFRSQNNNNNNSNVYSSIFTPQRAQNLMYNDYSRSKVLNYKFDMPASQYYGQ